MPPTQITNRNIPMARDPHIFQIGNANYTTREYCQSKGITDDYAIKKIQWRINTYIRNHPVRETTNELIRLVANTSKEIYILTPAGRRYHKKRNQHHEPTVTCQDARKDPLSDGRLDRQEENNEPDRKPIDGIRPWQGTKKEREIARQQLLKQSKWMEHNEKWLNEAGTLPDAQDIQKANKPNNEQNHERIHNAGERVQDLKHAVKQYAHAIQRVDELKALIDPLQLELEDAQKTLNEWHTNTINIMNTMNHKLQKWIGSE